MLIVITGTGEHQWIAERKLSYSHWDKTAQDIADGQLTDVSSVIQASTGQDVLPQIARDVMTIWANRGEGLAGWERDFIEQNVSVQAANKFRHMEPA